MRRLVVVALLGALFAACGGKPATAPAAPAPPPSVPADPGAPEGIPTSGITVSIVDLDDKPIPDVAAIVTEKANAFDEPLVRGAISGADGQSALRVPRDRATFVRGWDPKLNYFANSFFSVEAGDAPLPAETKVVMAPAAVLTLQLYGADGAPLAGDSVVEILFSHPEEGPWWPTRATTRPDGRVILDKVPAGKFDLRVDADAGHAELPGVLLMPKQAVDLGVVGLK